MDSAIKELQDEFIKRKWDVQVDVPITFKEIFDYKIPLFVKQNQLEYKIFLIPLYADSNVIDAIVDIARQYSHDGIIILALLHPDEAKYISACVRSRVALNTREVWEIIDNDVKLHKYQKELQEMRAGIDEINSKIRVLEHEMERRF